MFNGEHYYQIKLLGKSHCPKMKKKMNEKKPEQVPIPLPRAASLIFKKTQSKWTSEIVQFKIQTPCYNKEYSRQLSGNQAISRQL